MKVAYLIGNGFDLNAGMSTKFSDFCEYYKIITSDTDCISELKSKLKTEKDEWSNLELKLGEYTEFIKDTDTLYKILDDIRTELGKFISKEEEKATKGNVDVNTLREYLAFPESYLSRANTQLLEKFYKEQDMMSFDVSLISFNYSRFFDKLYSNKSPYNMSVTAGKRKVSSVSKIHHIHGFTDQDMVLGVNDASQIANSEFRNDEYVLNALVKTECNKGYGHLIDEDCKTIIEEANLICLFGLSIGETDKFWWELIAGQLNKRNDCRLIIFDGNGSSSRGVNSYHERGIRNSIRDKFLSLSNLSPEEQQKIKNYIYIGYNTHMFKTKIGSYDPTPNV